MPLSGTAYGSEIARSEQAPRTHSFHAESAPLRGGSGSPLMKAIHGQAPLSVDPAGGYLYQNTPEFRLDGVLSFKSAYSQVSGTAGLKPGQGWVTMSTSVIEGLNIADIVTADRIVAQISTEHPLEGYVPSVSFLGTHFENLRVAGRPVEFTLDLDMLGQKPAGDVPYLSDQAFRGRVQSQSDNLYANRNLSRSILERYSANPASVADGEAIDFSLIHQISGSFAGSTTGHIIHVPDFGDIHLATVKLSQAGYRGGTATCTTLELTMVETPTGNGATSLDDGTTGTGVTKTNGATRP